MIVEQPFGTVKRAMNAGYFLTRRLESVRVEANLGVKGTGLLSSIISD